LNDSGDRYIGVVAGGTNQAVLTKVIASGNLTVSGPAGSGAIHVGGLAGTIDGVGSSVTGCDVTVPITVPPGSIREVYAGGLAGRVYDTAFSTSIAKGNVTISGASNAYGGGFAGHMELSQAIETSQKTYATGHVTVSGNGNLWAGGFAGEISGTNEFKNIKATGNASIMPGGGSFGCCRAGGFVGEVVGYTKVDYSSATGAVTVGASASDKWARGTLTDNIDVAGGFAGLLTHSTEGTYTRLSATGVVTVYHEGDVTLAVGGLVGSAERANISYSSAAGDVWAESTTGNWCLAGGLVGRQATLDIAASYSKGDVKNKNDRHDVFAGGIAGLLAGGAKSINDCYSLGNITAEYTGSGSQWAMAGGILGTISGNKTTVGIRHCYAAGIVEAINQGGSGGQIISGGIAGELYPTQEGVHLVNNVYLGSSIQAIGSGTKHIRFLYAYGLNTGTNWSGYRWGDAVRKSSTSGTPSPISGGTNNLDGTSQTAGEISSGWSGWGFDATLPPPSPPPQPPPGTWAGPTKTSGGITRPTLYYNPETP
jgi:hypothetical protein